MNEISPLLVHEICNKEPITRLDRIQDFGFLFALSENLIVARVSANLEQHTGIAPAAALGTQFSRWVAPHALAEISSRIDQLRPSVIERMFGVSLLAGRPPVDLALHIQGTTLIIEGEPARKSERLAAASTVRVMTGQLVTANLPSDLYRLAAQHVQALTGYDRVMIYRFDAAHNGEVIADATRAGMESFLGLHYPASDIPPQARALYLITPFRLTADVSAVPVPILPQSIAPADALDLSRAISRSASPYHTEYLRNMGVGASLSISIIVGGRLWGLIACHAQAAKLPSLVMRTAAELFGAMFSMMLETRFQTDASADKQSAQERAGRLINAISANEALLSDPQWLLAMIRDMTPCDGVGIYRDGQVSTCGATVTDDGIRTIAGYLDRACPQEVFTTDRLGMIDAGLASGDSVSAGCMAIPISQLPGDYLMLFRNEKVLDARWGGDPSQPVVLSADGLQVSPRRDFAPFVQDSRGHALPFSAGDQRVADKFRRSLVDIMQRATEARNVRQAETADRENQTIAELHHRVGIILALIDCLVGQPEGCEKKRLSEYVGALDGRVKALARAHDRLTAPNAGPPLLCSLIAEEVGAPFNDPERFRLQGPDIALLPRAAAILALVIHALITNSYKYGALGHHGRVEVTTSAAPDGVTLAWRCLSGPSVLGPTQRGVDAMLIERAIPLYLQGTASAHYEASGFKADFSIPACFVHAPSSRA